MHIELSDSYPAWVWVVMLTGSALWLLHYALVIRRGALDDTWGMPTLVIAAHLSWELHYALVSPLPDGRWAISLTWAALDLVILTQAWRRGRDLFYAPASPAAYRAALLLALLAFWGLSAAMDAELEDRWGVYSAYLMLPPGSLLFMGMLKARGSTSGQSVWIGVTRLLGNLCMFIVWSIELPKQLLTTLIASYALVLDAAYITMLWRACLAEGISPWRRL